MKVLNNEINEYVYVCTIIWFPMKKCVKLDYSRPLKMRKNVKNRVIMYQKNVSKKECCRATGGGDGPA